MTTMKIRTTLVLAVVGALALASCAGGSEPKDSASGKPVTLKFMLSGDGTQGGGYQAMADKYKAETGVTVEIVDVPNDDLMTKLRNGAQAGDFPALAAASTVDPLWMDKLLDLSKIAKERKIMPSLLLKNHKNEIATLPTSLTAVGLFVNKTLFDKAGVAYPTAGQKAWTWDEYIAALKKVQAATGAKYGMVMDPSAHRLRSFLYQFGSKGVEKSKDGKFSVNSKTKPALEFFKKLNDDKIMPRSVWLSGDDPSALFKSGQVAAYYSGVWQVTDFSQNITAFEWASAKMPVEPVTATNLGTGWIVAYKGTGVEKETLKFIDWLYAPKNYTELSTIAGLLPVEKGLDIKDKAASASYDLYNEEIAASDPIAARQSVTQIEDAYNGKMMDNEPLKDETIKYLNGEQDVDQTIAAILKDTTEGMK